MRRGAAAVLLSVSAVLVAVVPWRCGHPSAQAAAARAVGTRDAALIPFHRPDFSCGDHVDPTRFGRTVDGVSAAIIQVTSAAHEAPQVTYALSVQHGSRIVDKGFGRVLVLDSADRVVAGQDDLAAHYPDRPHYGMDANLSAVRITPGHPYEFRNPPEQNAPCGGRTWPQLIAAGSKLVVLVRGWNLAHLGSGSDTLLASAPLAYPIPGAPPAAVNVSPAPRVGAP